MEKKLVFSDEQISFLKKHNLAPDDSLETTDGLQIMLMTKGFDEDYNPTYIGTMCEDILDLIADYDNDD